MGKYIIYTYNDDAEKINLFYCDSKDEANEIKKAIDLVLNNLNTINDNSNGSNILKFYYYVFDVINRKLQYYNTYGSDVAKYYKKISESQTVKCLINMHNNSKKEYIQEFKKNLYQLLKSHSFNIPNLNDFCLFLINNILITNYAGLFFSYYNQCYIEHINSINDVIDNNAENQEKLIT